MQTGLLVLAVVGVGVAWRAIQKRNAVEDSRDGISAECWRLGNAKVGTLGKWKATPVARLQRRLDAMTRTYNEAERSE